MVTFRGCPLLQSLVTAAYALIRARRERTRVARRQIVALRQRVAESRVSGRVEARREPPEPFTHRLRARRDTMRRARLRSELTPTSRTVLAGADRLLNACRPGQPPRTTIAPGETPPVTDP